MEALVRPLRSLEAKELYHVGVRPRGKLSRQPTEPMVDYILRRERWYIMLQRLDADIQISETIRVEILLDQAGINQMQRQLVLSSVRNRHEWSRVSTALRQHFPNIHEQREREERDNRHRQRLVRRPWRAYEADFEENTGEGDDDDEPEHDDDEYQVYLADMDDYEAAEYLQYEIVESFLDGGVDPDLCDEDTRELIADVANDEVIAYFTGTLSP